MKRGMGQLLAGAVLMVAAVGCGSDDDKDYGETWGRARARTGRGG